MIATIGGASRADDREAAADAMVKAASTARTLTTTARGSRNRDVRTTFATRSAAIADDLATLARYTRTDGLPLKSISNWLYELAKHANELTDAADAARLKGQARELARGIVAARQTMILLVIANQHATPLSSEAFKQRLVDVRNEKSDREKYITARGDESYFTSTQVSQLIELLSDESWKVDLAEELWSHLIDPQNAAIIFEKLEHESAKAELHRRVG